MPRGGSRPGAGRKHKATGTHQQGLRPWVPVDDPEDVALIEALAPAERTRRLVGLPYSLQATAPDGGQLLLEWGAEVRATGTHPHGMTAAQEEAIGRALGALHPTEGGNINLDVVIAELEAAGYQVGAIIL